jgi:hypothetical protein
MPKKKTRSRKTVVEQKVKWDKIPSIMDLQKARPWVMETHPPPGQPRGEALEFGLGAAPGYARDDYLSHGAVAVEEVKKRYGDAGFQTDKILQDPFGHPGPTAAFTVGFLSNLPAELWDNSLRIFFRFICRVHVDIATLEGGEVVSVPHVEPDAKWQMAEHLYYAYRMHQEVKGKPAVNILRHFLGV